MKKYDTDHLQDIDGIADLLTELQTRINEKKRSMGDKINVESMLSRLLDHCTHNPQLLEAISCRLDILKSESFQGKEFIKYKTEWQIEQFAANLNFSEVFNMDAKKVISDDIPTGSIWWIYTNNGVLFSIDPLDIIEKDFNILINDIKKASTFPISDRHPILNQYFSEPYLYKGILKEECATDAITVPFVDDNEYEIFRIMKDHQIYLVQFDTSLILMDMKEMTFNHITSVPSIRRIASNGDDLISAEGSSAVKLMNLSIKDKLKTIPQTASSAVTPKSIVIHGHRIPPSTNEENNKHLEHVYRGIPVQKKLPSATSSLNDSKALIFTGTHLISYSAGSGADGNFHAYLSVLDILEGIWNHYTVPYGDRHVVGCPLNSKTLWAIIGYSKLVLVSLILTSDKPLNFYVIDITVPSIQADLRSVLKGATVSAAGTVVSRRMRCMYFTIIMLNCETSMAIEIRMKVKNESLIREGGFKQQQHKRHQPQLQQMHTVDDDDDALESKRRRDNDRIYQRVQLTLSDQIENIFRSNEPHDTSKGPQVYSRLRFPISFGHNPCSMKHRPQDDLMIDPLLKCAFVSSGYHIENGSRSKLLEDQDK